MIIFPAYATNFEFYPQNGDVAQYLAPLLNNLGKINFEFRINDPKKNRGQMKSNFDSKLKEAFQSRGATLYNLALPADVPQELDFTFKFLERIVAVEIEKANREKILRDILKSHIYLHAGACFAVVGLPRNYAHKHGEWNLFKFGVERYDECHTYGFGSPDKLGKIALLGFDQYVADGDRKLNKEIREEMRQKAATSK
ncbi:MAG TPA: hypothetical protein PK528_12590 [Syntrophorhabdus sp.]|nr:hypothetical protein [Syntrophorhabdus sp.]